MIEAWRPVGAISEVKIIERTPTNPIITPPAFLKVIGSFKIKKDIIIARIGVIVITIDALVAVVSCNPWINAA